MAFAHAQFSSHVLGLKIGAWQFSAWLDAQGRVRFFFHLARLADEQLLMLLRGGDATRLAEALQRFVFRARVRITARTDWPLGTGPALPLHAVRQACDGLPASLAGGDSGAFFLGCDTYSLAWGKAVEPNDAWRLPQIRGLWPWLPDNALDLWLSPALGLDRLDATALDKGCYPGQEMVARLHYRGGHKRHLHHVTLSQPLAAGSILHRGERELMRLLDVMPAGAGAEALAVIPDDVGLDRLNYAGLDAAVLATEPTADASVLRVTVRKTRLSPQPDVDPAE